MAEQELPLKKKFCIKNAYFYGPYKEDKLIS